MSALALIREARTTNTCICNSLAEQLHYGVLMSVLRAWTSNPAKTTDFLYAYTALHAQTDPHTSTLPENTNIRTLRSSFTASRVQSSVCHYAYQRQTCKTSKTSPKTAAPPTPRCNYGMRQSSSQRNSSKHLRPALHRQLVLLLSQIFAPPAIHTNHAEHCQPAETDQRFFVLSRATRLITLKWCTSCARTLDNLV